MDPTTSGRFRVHNRRPRPAIGGDEADADRADHADRTDRADHAQHDGSASTADDGRPDEFVLVELPDGPVDPTDPDAADQFDPLYATAEGYEDDLAECVSALEPGFVVEATVAWTDGSARFVDIDVVRESRFYFADEVEGMFEAAVEAWRQVRADGEAVGSITTRSNDGDPNGALYLFADAPGGDTFADLRAGRLPIEPLVARVNESREEGPREVFVLRPASHDFVAVYVVFDRDGVLAQTVRDTYGLGPGLATGLEAGEFEAAKADSGDDGDDFDALDRL
jgi:hypothetical protein